MSNRFFFWGKKNLKQLTFCTIVDMADIQSTTTTTKNTLKDKGTLPADANVNIFLVYYIELSAIVTLLSYRGRRAV